MAAFRALLIAATVFITALSPLFLRAMGSSSDDPAALAVGPRNFALSASSNAAVSANAVVVQVITATPVATNTPVRPTNTPVPPTATTAPAPPAPVVAPPPPPPPAVAPAAPAAPTPAVAPAQAPRQLPRTGEAEFGLYGLMALGALIVLAAAGLALRRRSS